MKCGEIIIYFKIGTTAGTLEQITLIIGIIIGFLFGGWNDILTALLVAQFLDICTGVMVGAKFKKLSSKRMKEGLYRKIGIWFLIVFAHMIDMVFFDYQMIALTGVALSFIATEGLSLMENLSNLGVNVPGFIKKYLEQVRDNQDIKEINLEKKEIKKDKIG